MAPGAPSMSAASIAAADLQPISPMLISTMDSKHRATGMTHRVPNTWQSGATAPSRLHRLTYRRRSLPSPFHGELGAMR